MALNLPKAGNGENRMPIIKYDARAGRIFRVDRSNDSGSWEATALEITNGFQALMDLENIEIGWLHFPTGGAPDMRLAKLGQGLPDKPTEKHRSGFRVEMLLGKQSGGGLREMAANAQVSVAAMDDLHDAYMAQRDAHPGEVPVVVLSGTTPITTQGKDATGKPVSSTNYQPVWQIVAWKPRPVELTPGYVPPEAQAPVQAPAPAPAPAQAYIPPPAPPAPAPVPAAAAVNAYDDF